jgi:hypothetical protein
MNQEDDRNNMQRHRGRYPARVGMKRTITLASSRVLLPCFLPSIHAPPSLPFLQRFGQDGEEHDYGLPCGPTEARRHGKRGLSRSCRGGDVGRGGEATAPVVVPVVQDRGGEKEA